MGWYEAVKDAASLAQKADNIDLMRQLLDAQKEMMDLQQENYQNKQRIQDLEALINKVKRIEYNENRTAVYELQENGIKEGPYCTRCWEADKKTITLNRTTSSLYYCPHCKNKVKGLIK